MSVMRWEWGAVAVVIAVPLCYFGYTETGAEQGGYAAAAGEGSAQGSLFGQEGIANCSGVIYSSPFGKSKAGCGGGAAPPAAAEGGDARELRAKLSHVLPCKGQQQANNLTRDCAEQNAGAASLVRQLEALVEQGQVQAGAELSSVIERERKAGTASGEYLDELERAEAVLMRIAASGGIDADRKIARPAAMPPDRPRFANRVSN